MFMICERCYGPIGEGEPLVRLAHIDQALPDGNVSWVYAYLHQEPCTPPRPAPHQQPDTGSWDPARGIGGLRP